MIEQAKQNIVKLLRGSERYMRTDMVYLAQGGFWLLAEKMTTIAFGFLVSVAFANLIEPEKYGVYKYVVSVIGVIGAFTLSGMTTAVNHAVARGYEGALRAGFKTYFRWSIPAMIATFILAAYYFIQNNNTLGISFLIAGSLTPLIGSASLYDSFLSGSQRFTAKAFYGTVRNALPPLLLIGTLFITHDPLAIVAVYFVSTGAATYWCYHNVMSRFAPKNQTDGGTLDYSKHLSVMGILDTVAAQADRVLIFSLLGGTPLAWYSFAEVAPDQLRGFANVIGTLAFPKLARQPIDVIKKTLPRKMLLLFVAAAIATAMYIIFAPWFFSVFFPKYVAVVVYSQVYALTVLIAPGVLVSRTLLAHAKHRELYTQKLILPVLRIALLLILIPRYGVWGAVSAILVSYAAMGVVMTWQFLRLT